MSRPEIDITGRTYRLLTAVRRTGSIGGRHFSPVWLFKCACGNEVRRKKEAVVCGKVVSCGCLARARGEKVKLRGAIREEIARARSVLRDMDTPRRALLLDRSKEKYRARRLRQQYDLTPEQYDALLQAQGGGCAVCHQPPVGTRLNVDHSHTTGQVRGLLCRRCNLGIGMFDDDKQRLAASILYLSRTE